MLSDRILYDERLDATDVRLWGIMAHVARHRDRCGSTDDSLALKLGKSPQTVRRSLLRLERCGYITRGKGHDGGRLIELWPEGDHAEIAPLTIQVVG